MTHFTEKQQAYIDARANGLKGRAAALAAGYSTAGADVTSARLNRDVHIVKAIAAAKRALQKGGKAVKPEDDPDKPRLKANYPSSLELLRGVYNNARMADSVRIDAAKAALPYEHNRMGEAGKKEKAKDRASEIARGGKKGDAKPKFATKNPPPLRVVGGSG